MGNGPFSPEQVARVWTIPVVATQAMTANKFMVGASVGAQIFDRQDATVEISTEHSDFFARNMVLLRAEERLALAVYRTTAWTKGDFTAAITAAGG
jgi:HK97 family phage major capsid protein